MATQSYGVTGYGSPEPGERPSADDPDAIRERIEATRAELAGDVDRLADRASPKRVARRNWDRVRSRISNAKESVMGTPKSAGNSVRGTTQHTTAAVQDKAASAADSVRDATSSAADTLRESPAMAREKTRGNPLAAGLIAFGAGLLAATLLPETKAERQAGQKLADQGSNLVDKVREPLAEAVGQVKQDATESARQSAQEVRSTAQEAAERTTQTAKESGQQAKDDVRQTASQ